MQVWEEQVLPFAICVKWCQPEELGEKNLIALEGPTDTEIRNQGLIYGLFIHGFVTHWFNSPQVPKVVEGGRPDLNFQRLCLGGFLRPQKEHMVFHGPQNHLWRCQKDTSRRSWRASLFMSESQIRPDLYIRLSTAFGIYAISGNRFPTRTKVQL